MPIRARGVDPGLLTKGNGKYEWRGFLSKNKHIHGTDPRDGTITNWNNIAAHGFGAADDDWGGNGSAARVDLLDYNLDRLKRNGKWTLASVVAAMNAAATQDVRAIDTVPLLQRLLKGSSAPTPQAEQMLALLGAWRANGGSRLDRDLDGLIDDPGAAIMDAAWPGIANACIGTRLTPDQLDELRTLFSRWSAARQRLASVRRLVPVPGPRHPHAARRAREAAARELVLRWGQAGQCPGRDLAAIAAAGEELTAEQGTADPSAWRADATAERIEFVPGAPADDDALHEPPERDPAGDLVRGLSLHAKAPAEAGAFAAFLGLRQASAGRGA